LVAGGFLLLETATVTRVTLNYWTVYDDVEQLRKFADENHAIRSHVTVNVKQVREDQFEQLLSMLWPMM
jgi:hypothetical protein